jgi:hypothetical protein
MAWLTRQERQEEERLSEDRRRRRYSYTRSALIRALRDMPCFEHLRGQFFYCVKHIEDECGGVNTRKAEEFTIWTWEDRPGKEWPDRRRHYQVYKLSEVIDRIADTFGCLCRLCQTIVYFPCPQVISADCVLCYTCGNRFEIWLSRSKRLPLGSRDSALKDDPLLFHEWLARFLKIQALELRRGARGLGNERCGSRR